MSDELRDVAIEWAALTVTQGEVLDAFAAYCDDLDDVATVEREGTKLELAWKGRERSIVALGAGVPAASLEEPTLLIADLADELVERFLDDEALRARLAVYDLRRLEKINAVRSSVFVYFEWFLRDLYGVKLLPSPGFTQGLVERGIISLGMG
ncbi:MAG TPA: hypothetical protein VGJ58_03150 [Gaiellaceae bacterium]|jgi:hypothetical protein